MGSVLVQLTSCTCLLLLMVHSTQGQCAMPFGWTSSALWGANAKSEDSTIIQMDFVQYKMSGNDLMRIEKSSNKESKCIELVTEANGATMMLFETANGNKYCVWGKIGTRALFQKVSVISTTNPPTSVNQCYTQTGITGDIVDVLIPVPPKKEYGATWPGVSVGDYLISVKFGEEAAKCVGDELSVLTIASNSLKVDSPCIDKSVVTYNNPFSKEMFILDVVTDQYLGFSASTTSGFVVVNTENDLGVPFRPYALRYVFTNAEMIVFMETNPPQLEVRGYTSVQQIPAANKILYSGITTKQCSATPPYCNNGGTCVPGFSSATCKCTPQFEGNRCENVVNMCSPNPCNGGTCTMSSMDTNCNCPTGTTGKYCDIQDKCTVNGVAVCKNSASCTSLKIANQDIAYCICVTPWYGDTCDMYNPCLATPCQNSGVCLAKNDAQGPTDYKCQCAPNYYGENCENAGLGACSSSPCANGGECLALGTGFKCNCKPGYSGTTCQSTGGTCTNDPCQNGGQCLAVGAGIFCECTQYYGGDYCEEYEDWFIIMLVLVILVSIIMFILIIVCACYCCCGWRPGGNKTPYEAYSSNTSGDAVPYQGSVNFNFVPQTQFQGISTGGYR